MTTINEQGYNWLLEKVSKLNQRLPGCEPLVVNATRVLYPVVWDDSVLDGREYVVKPGDERGRPVRRHVPMYDVEITGTPPVLPGYKFLGTVEHLGEDGNILKEVPGCSLPTEYRHATPLCQHCGLIRRRSQTFVLTGPDGLVQVGRNCLADFIRSPEAAERLLSWAGMVDELFARLHEFTENDGSGKPLFMVDDLNRLAVAYGKVRPWVSGKKAYESGLEPSAGRIRAFMSGWKITDPQEKREWTEIVELAKTEAVEREAQEVADWVNGVLGTTPDEQIDNYQANLVVLFRQHAVTADKIALVCSAHRAYYGYKAREQRRTEMVHSSDWVGTEGVRGEFEVTVREIKALGPGEYGERFLVRMTDPAGNLIVWFTGENCKLEVDLTKTIWVKATVAKHDLFNDRKQTQFSRVTQIAGPTPPKVKKPRGKKAVQP